MDICVENRHGAVREGYQILLRADAVLRLPPDAERIAEYYRSTALACLRWAEQAEGERLRRAYLALESNRERARFRPSDYRLECGPVWEGNGHAAWVCRSELRGAGGAPFVRCTAQVWNLTEQTLLPPAQVLRLFRPAGRRRWRPPFRPDGVYPLGGELVFFRNGGAGEPVREFRVPAVPRG